MTKKKKKNPIGLSVEQFVLLVCFYTAGSMIDLPTMSGTPDQPWALSHVLQTCISHIDAQLTQAQPPVSQAGGTEELVFIIPDMSYVPCRAQISALVCSLVAAADTDVRQLWFLTCPASQQDWVCSSLPVSLWRAIWGGWRGEKPVERRPLPWLKGKCYLLVNQFLVYLDSVLR